jgi:hypothetical protein
VGFIPKPLIPVPPYPVEGVTVILLLKPTFAVVAPKGELVPPPIAKGEVVGPMEKEEAPIPKPPGFTPEVYPV